MGHEGYMEVIKVTRGNGCLETFLARKRSETADKLIPYSLRRGRILDVGCGTFPFFLRNTEFDQKYAIDKIAEADQQSFLNYGIKIMRHDIEKEEVLPFENEYFDVVSMLAVFEHIEPAKLDGILKEIYRVLKSRGIYVLTTPAPWTNNLLKIMATLNLVSKVEIEEHKAAYDPRRVSTLLQGASFSEDKIKHGYFEVFMNIWVTATK
jgi:SAM-dependent methyltransferase